MEVSDESWHRPQGPKHMLFPMCMSCRWTAPLKQDVIMQGTYARFNWDKSVVTEHGIEVGHELTLRYQQSCIKEAASSTEG